MHVCLMFNDARLTAILVHGLMKTKVEDTAYHLLHMT